MLILKDPLERVETLMGKLKDFDFKINNNQKTRLITKNMKIED